MMRKLLKIVAWTFGSLLALILIAMTLVYVFSDSIKNSVVQEVNKYLSAKVEVGEIELSAWRHFPQIGIYFHQVRI